LSLTGFIKGDASSRGSSQKGADGFGREQERIARDQENGVVQLRTDPGYDAVQTVEMRRVSQHFAPEQRRSFFITAQNHGPLNTRLCQTLLEPVNASKHLGLILPHPSTDAAGEDDGYNAHGHPSVHAVEFIKGCFEFCK